MKQLVRMRLPIRMMRDIYPPDTYVVKPGKWWERWAWKLLQRGRCVQPYAGQDMVENCITIDPEDFGKKLIVKVLDGLRQVNMKPKMMYMGRKEFIELTEQMPPEISPLSLNVPLLHQEAQTVEEYPGYKVIATVFDIPVTVIPWMEGILIV